MNLQDFLSNPSDRSKTTTKEWLPFASLEIKSGKLWSGDPNLPNELDGFVAEVPPGTYLVEGIGMQFEDEGVVSRLRVRLEGAPNPTLGEELGEAGTDSATIGVCDISAFEEAYLEDGGAEKVQDAIDALGDAFFGVLQVPEYSNAVMPFVPTGSDGNGPVYALMSDGKRIGIELTFMDDEDAN